MFLNILFVLLYVVGVVVQNWRGKVVVVEFWNSRINYFRILILYRRIMLYWYSKNIYLRNIFINLFLLCLFYRCFDAPLGCFALHLHAFCLFYTNFSCFSCFPGFPGFPGFPLYFFIF